MAVEVRSNTTRYPLKAAVAGSMTKLSQFLDAVRTAALASTAAESLILCAHANDYAQFFMLLSDEHEQTVKSEKRKAAAVLYEDLEKAVSSGAINIPGPVLLPRPLDANGQPIPAYVHIKGCRIGDNTKFLQKFKEALGGQVLITAPTYFHELFESGASDDGIYEYMGHSFVVFSTTKVATRKALIDQFKAKNYKLMDGSDVPDTLWHTWIRKDYFKVRKREVLIDVTPSPKVGKFAVYGGSWGDYRHQIEKFTFTLPNAASQPKDRPGRLTVLHDQMKADPQFATSAYPVYERYGHVTFDKFFDARFWSFSVDKKSGDLLAVGTRHAYTCNIPTVVQQGKAFVLKDFNYYAYSGVGNVLTGLVESNPFYFVEV
jgi:hypothetical protein